MKALKLTTAAVTIAASTLVFSCSADLPTPGTYRGSSVDESNATIEITLDNLGGEQSGTWTSTGQLKAGKISSSSSFLNARTYRLDVTDGTCKGEFTMAIARNDDLIEGVVRPTGDCSLKRARFQLKKS